MNDFIFERIHDGNLNDSLIYDFANSLNLNIKKFKEDYNSIQTHNLLLNNKEHLLSNNIFSTPTLIIEGKIYDEKNILPIISNKYLR